MSDHIEQIIKRPPRPPWGDQHEQQDFKNHPFDHCRAGSLGRRRRHAWMAVGRARRGAVVRQRLRRLSRPGLVAGRPRTCTTRSRKARRSISYDIFLNLEVAGSQELFRSDANSERYGLITQAANPRTNPDGLPVGLSKTVGDAKAAWKGEYIGLTCAACHNAQLNYKGKRIRIDGGVGNTSTSWPTSRRSTTRCRRRLTDAAKFDRLATRVGASSAEAKADLRKRFESDAERVHYYRTRTVLRRPIRAGPSRMDAISAIVNRLTADRARHSRELVHPARADQAAVSLECPAGHRGRNGAASQQDPIDRNLTETMGVYMPMDLTSKTPAGRAVRLERAIEQSAEDRGHAAAPGAAEMAGRGLRQDRPRRRPPRARRCSRTTARAATTPGPIPGPSRTSTASASSRSDWCRRSTSAPIRTSSRTCGPTRSPRQLAPYLPPPFKDKDIVPTGCALRHRCRSASSSTALAEAQADAEEQTLKLHGYREFPLPRPPEGVYKAAPRDGVWATPPFMHNGSVPNLYEMLHPGEGAHEEVLRRARVRSGQGRARHQRQVRQRSCSTRRCAAIRTPATRSRTARAATASSARC